MKHLRQEKILKIINENTVETQEQLIEKLEEAGFNVTQATVSRDIRELKLTKIACGFGVYKYVVSSRGGRAHSAKYSNILKETVTDVNYAGNIVVVRTYSGMAQAAAAAIDSMEYSEVVGSIAGDDTVMIVIRSADLSRSFAHELAGILNIRL